MPKIILALLLMSGFATQALATTEQGLERGLLDALRLKAGTTTRVSKSGPAIMAYVREGYLDRKPVQRADYSDYRLFKKPAHLLGQTMVLLEEEYMTEHLGCCVSEGVGIIFKVTGGTGKLELFAKQNGCTFKPHVNLATELKSVGIDAPAPAGEYASLACKERDAVDR